MKALFKLVVLLLVIAVAVPIAQYRTVKPCTMLRKELVWRTERQLRDAGQQAREGLDSANVELSEDTEALVGDIAGVVSDVAVGVAEGVATARVRRMSSGQCLRELVRVKLGLGGEE
jgi:hypothetical protein